MAIPESMTLYFMKSSGEITAFCTGAQDMSYFNTLEADYSIIMSYVVIPYDDYVLENQTSFRINPATLGLELKEVIATNLDKYAKQTV